MTCMSRAHSPTFPSLHLRHSSFSNPSVALPTSQLILQPFRYFTYVTDHSPTLLSPLLRHRIFTYFTWRDVHGKWPTRLGTRGFGLNLLGTAAAPGRRRLYRADNNNDNNNSCLSFYDGHVLQLWSEIIAIRRRMNMVLHDA